MNEPKEATSVLRLAAPLIISFCMRSAFTFVDTAYAAILGDAAVAAIGLTVPFEFIMIATFVGLSTGLTSLLSRAIGSCEGEKIQQYLKLGWKLVLLISPAFVLIGLGIWFWAPTMELEREVARDFQIYGAVLIGGSAFTAFWSVIPDSLIKAHHDTRSTMWAGIWSNVINVTLNTIFLFVFEWGIFGIAFSTVLGRFGGLAYALVRARHHERVRVSHQKDFKPGLDPNALRKYMGLSVPASIAFLLMATETALINYILAHGDHPTESIAAYSIYYRVVLLALTPMIALGVAMLPFISRRVGRRDLVGVRQGLNQATISSLVYSVVLLGPLMILTTPFLAKFLTESPITYEYTKVILYMVPIACLFSGPFLYVRPVFEGLQQGRPGLIMAALRYVVLTGPFAWLGARSAMSFGFPALFGLVVALLLVGLIVSVIFQTWITKRLSKCTDADNTSLSEDYVKAGVVR